MAQAFIDNLVIIKYWFKLVDMLYEYEFNIGTQKAMGEFKNESSLKTMAANLSDLGYEVKLEKGYWKKTWVPYGE